MSWPSLQWPRRPEAILISPARSTNLKVRELQTAKEILAEIFWARPEDIEDLIQRGLAIGSGVKSTNDRQPSLWSDHGQEL
jgi:hypothetical protein